MEFLARGRELSAGLEKDTFAFSIPYSHSSRPGHLLLLLVTPRDCYIEPGSMAEAKLSLSYPLYCADFDPNNDGFLFVGGGGGEGRSGVGNKIVSL